MEKRYLGNKIQAFHVRTDILEEYHTGVMRVKCFGCSRPIHSAQGRGKRKTLRFFRPPRSKNQMMIS